MNEKYFTIPEAAKAVGITIRTLRNWINAGELSYNKVGVRNGRRRKLVLKSDIEDLLR